MDNPLPQSGFAAHAGRIALAATVRSANPRDLIDAIDNALADEVKAESAGKPTMPEDLLDKMLSGEISALAAWRCAAGLSQADLAERASIAVSYVVRIENAPLDANPRYSVLRRLATVLGLGVDDIMPAL